MLNIATMGILKGNANPETPGGGKRPPKGEYVKYIHIPYGGYVQYVQSALGDNRHGVARLNHTRSSHRLDSILSQMHGRGDGSFREGQW